LDAGALREIRGEDFVPGGRESDSEGAGTQGFEAPLCVIAGRDERELVAPEP
jgi:hypothetical protein